MRLIDSWQALAQPHRSKRGLEDLSDHILRDIGLDRRPSWAEIAHLLTDSRTSRI